MMGPFPLRTADPAEARRLYERDGCVVLMGLGTDASVTTAVARRVFGHLVREAPPAAEVRIGGDKDRKPADIDQTTPIPPHTDGFSYGDCYPDVLVLLCANASPVGGESFLVDGNTVIERLTANGEGEFVERLRTVLIDQTEPDMHRARSPVIGATAAGRPMLRLFSLQRPATDSMDFEADAAMIAAWEAAIYEAATESPRFKLEPGEALIADNYRMMHGREPYDDLDRLLWRGWVWTTAAFGVPAGMLHSDSRYAITT